MAVRPAHQDAACIAQHVAFPAISVCGCAFSSLRVVDKILRQPFRHVHGGHVPESFLAILRRRLSDFAHPVGRAFGRQCEAHQAQDHHDAAHDAERAILAAGDDNAGDFALDGAAAGGAVLFVECVESFDQALHQARTAAPPDRRAEQHDVCGLDLRDEVRPVVLGGFPKAKPDRQGQHQRGEPIR